MSVSNDRGVALLITLTIITVIMTVTFELNRQMRASVTDAAATRDLMTASEMVRTGVDIGKAILVRDKYETEIDSVQEEWADPEKIEQYLSQISLENCKISLFISDERSRIQINSLVRFPEGREFNPPQHELWQRFAGLLLVGKKMSDESGDLDSLEPDMIINPVKDWLDSDDDDALTGLSGAENDYYRSLDDPYGCRNGPIKDVTELLRIRNITPELFYSLDEKVSGIGNYVTVHGMSPAGENRHDFTFDGKININTAQVPVIAAMLPMGQEFLAEEIVAWREEKAGDQYVHDLSDAKWYKQVPGAGDIEIKEELITTSSDLFRIDCKVESEDSIVSATVIVEREKEEKTGRWRCRILKWKYN